MRERLFQLIHELENNGWKDNSNHTLLSQLRYIAENFSKIDIDELLEVFHRA